MALLGVQEPARFKNCLTPPTLSEMLDTADIVRDACFRQLRYCARCFEQLFLPSLR
jgi:hypothetical protein